MEREPSSVNELSFAWLSILQSQAKLFHLESQLAKLSLLPFMICVFTVIFMILCLSISSQLFIGYLIFSWTENGIISLFLLVLIDLFLLCLGLLMILKYKNRMRFERSRAALKEWIS